MLARPRLLAACRPAVFACALAVAVGGMALLGCGDDTIRHPAGDMGRDLSVGGGDMHTAGTCTAGRPQRLSDLPGAHVSPRIAWNGSGFVIAWNTLVAAGARVDVVVTDGVGANLGPNLPLSAQPVASPRSPPSVAPLASGTVVAWTRVVGGGSDIVFDTFDANGERLDGNGTPCDPSVDGCGIFAVTTSGHASFPALGRPSHDTHGAPTDATVTLAFVDGRNHCGAGGCDGLGDVFWTQAFTGGMELTGERQVTPPGSNVASSFPRMAFDGMHDGLVWRDDTLAGVSRFLFATVDGSGNVASGPGIVGSAAGDAIVESVPDLVFAGGSFALASASGDVGAATVMLQRFGADGTAVLQPTAVTTGASACAPAIATDGSDFALVWQAPCDQSGAEVSFALVDPMGTRLGMGGVGCAATSPDCGVVTASRAAGVGETASAPSVAWAGNGFGVAWVQGARADGGAGPRDVWFARVDCPGL